jgi:hypothetical protein
MNSVNLLTNIKSFRDKDLETCKKLINVATWPEYYSNEFFANGKRLPISIVSFPGGDPIGLMSIDKINLSETHKQHFRFGGDNANKSEIRLSLHQNGYFLDVQPIRLRLHKNGELTAGAGITRLELLIELGFKNILCTVYKGDDDASDIEVNNAFNVFFFRDNASHRPVGMITPNDVIFNVKNSIINGEIALDTDAIRQQVFAMTEPTHWTKKTKEQTVAMIFNACNNLVDAYGAEIIVKSYKATSAISDFMSNYKDTPTIKYMNFSTSSTKKIAYAVGEELKKHNKKIRLILNTDRLDGSLDQEADYIKRINEAKEELEMLWKRLSSFFNGADISDRVEIYGCLPAVSSLTPNMNEMVVFGVNDAFLKNYSSTKTKKSLNKTLGISSFIKEEEVTD